MRFIAFLCVYHFVDANEMVKKRNKLSPKGTSKAKKEQAEIGITNMVTMGYGIWGNIRHKNIANILQKALL